MKTGSFLGHSPLGPHRIAYTEWGAENGGVPVICVHALTFSGRTFDRLAEALQNRGRQVLCPDIAGRGRSDRLSDPKLYDNANYIPGMAELIARTGAAQVDWVGTSMGGLIGIMMAGMPDSPIHRLVLNDIGPFVALEALLGIAAYLSMLPAGFTDLREAQDYFRKTYAAFGNLSDGEWRHLVEHDVRRLPDRRWARLFDPAIAENIASSTRPIDLWESYDKIACPTLVLRGENSKILSADTAQEMARRGPRAKVITFPGIGHHPALMNAEQISIVAGFLGAA